MLSLVLRTRWGREVAGLEILRILPIDPRDREGIDSPMPILSIPAHYDGVRVHLDEEVRIAPNTRLIVTVLDDIDTDREEFLRLSSGSLAAYYDEDEVEYSEGDLKP